MDEGADIGCDADGRAAWVTVVATDTRPKDMPHTEMVDETTDLRSRFACLENAYRMRGNLVVTLQDEVARLTALVSSAAPDSPKPNPFREFPTDQHRIGNFW